LRNRHGAGNVLLIHIARDKLRHKRATEEIRELAALYALGSLTQHEARSFEIHLREGCSVCEEEFRKFEHVVSGLGLSADEVDAPDYIRDLLLARAEREPQVSSSAGRPARKSDAGPSQGKPPLTYAAKEISPKSGGSKSGIFAWVFAVAFVAVAVLAFFLWESAQRANIQSQASLSASHADADNLRILLNTQKEKAGDLEQIIAMVSKPGTRVARLIGQEAAPSSSGAILWDIEQNRCLLFGFFPPAPPGKTYEIWFVTPTARVPSGLVQSEPTGRVFTTIPVPADAANAAAALVTLEPDNGSQIPTAPFYAVGRFD
jgi:anti-sigma-K factor RskA